MNDKELVLKLESIEKELSKTKKENKKLSEQLIMTMGNINFLNEKVMKMSEQIELLLNKGGLEQHSTTRISDLDIARFKSQTPIGKRTMEYLAKGLSNVEIGEKEDIGTRAARARVVQLQAKFKCNTRAEIIALAERLLETLECKKRGSHNETEISQTQPV